MKYLSKGITVIFAALLFITIGCGSTGGASYPEGSLEAQINNISGVRITGTGDYAKVVIRPRKLSGARRGQGFEGKMDDGHRDSYDNPPLFVVDGRTVGRDFKELRDMLRNSEIESAELLSHDEASQYGRNRSLYGVIAITTKKSNDSQKGS